MLCNFVAASIRTGQSVDYVESEQVSERLLGTSLNQVQQSLG